MCFSLGLFSVHVDRLDSCRISARGVPGYDSARRMSRRIWLPRGVAEFDLIILWPSISRLKNSFTIRFHAAAGAGVSSASPLLCGDSPLSLSWGRPLSSQRSGAGALGFAGSSAGEADGGVVVVDDSCARVVIVRL